MFGKNFVGFAVGVVVGAAVTTGAAIAYYYCKVKKKVCCDKCEMSGECECCGKYAHACLGDCIVEECAKFSVEDFQKTE